MDLLLHVGTVVRLTVDYCCVVTRPTGGMQVHSGQRGERHKADMSQETLSSQEFSEAFSCRV